MANMHRLQSSKLIANERAAAREATTEYTLGRQDSLALITFFPLLE